MTGNSRKHPRPNVFAIMEGKYIVGPTIARKCFMGTGLPFNEPADTQQRGQNTGSLN
jgi:hypothetical protein